MTLKAWPKHFKSMQLLSASNPKTSKGEDLGYITWIQYLLPYKAADGVHNLCPMAHECIRSCLNYAGRGGLADLPKNKTQEARLRRATLFLRDRSAFAVLLVKEIEAAIRYTGRFSRSRSGSDATPMTPVFRLNGLSDVVYEHPSMRIFGGASIFERFPHVQFYDYTKIHTRFDRPLPHNYHLTLSAQPSNVNIAQRFLREKRCNVAVVFKPFPPRYRGLEREGLAKPLPPEWWGARVLNGDETDLRFLDPGPGNVVGLHFKVSKRDPETFAKVSQRTATVKALESGFVQMNPPEDELVEKFTNSQPVFDPVSGGVWY